MSSHRARRRPWPRRVSGRSRALLSLAAVGALAVGMGTQGTFAYFTDKATATTGSFTAGTLDVTLNGSASTTGLANNPGTTTVASFTLGTMVPGESVATTIAVASAGSVPFVYTVSGTAPGTLATGLAFSVYAGTANAATGTQAAGTRAQTCSGTALATNVVLAATSTPLVSTARNLAAAGSENLCVIATLSTSAANALQGATTTANIVFDAKQVNAP